jgi:hypothetical protein
MQKIPQYHRAPPNKHTKRLLISLRKIFVHGFVCHAYVHTMHAHCMQSYRMQLCWVHAVGSQTTQTNCCVFYIDPSYCVFLFMSNYWKIQILNYKCSTQESLL